MSATSSHNITLFLVEFKSFYFVFGNCSLTLFVVIVAALTTVFGIFFQIFTKKFLSSSLLTW